MAGLSNYSQIGALQPGEATADANAPAQVPAAVSSPTPGGGGLEQRANMGFAIGDVYNAYKKAQLDNVTEATQLSKASRDRLTQIWQAGKVNPNLQNDPKIHKQIGQYWKQVMGVDFPTKPGDTFDWDMLQPPKSINELSEPMLKQLQEMDPKRRAAAAKAMNLIDAGDAFLNAPAMMSDSAKAKFSGDYTRIMLQGGKNGMTGNEFMQWVETNHEALNQTMGDGTADAILNDPHTFEDMKASATAALAKLQAQTDKLKGVDPLTKQKIKDDIATANAATSLADLRKVQMKYIGTENAQLPGIDAARIRQMNASADQDTQNVNFLRARVDSLVSGGIGSPRADVQNALKQATDDLRIATSANTSAINSGMAPPDYVSSAMSTAQARVDALQGQMDTINNPDVQKRISALRAQNVTGNNTNPVNTKHSTFTPGSIPPGATPAPDGKRYYIPGQGVFDKATGNLSANQN